MKKERISVVYFDQLLGAAHTQKLVETFKTKYYLKDFTSVLFQLYLQLIELLQ